MPGKSGGQECPPSFITIQIFAHSVCRTAPLAASELGMDEKSLDSFRSSLDANYEWPCIYPFKFIVPKAQVDAVLELFADDPVRAKDSSSGRFTAFTMEMNMHSCDEVIAVYQRVAQIEGVISL